MKKIIFAFALCLMACTDEANSRRTLENSGYTDITLRGYAPYSCGKDDTYATAFSAKNPAGKYVDGVVCCGFATKGCTVRF